MAESLPSKSELKVLKEFWESYPMTLQLMRNCAEARNHYHHHVVLTYTVQILRSTLYFSNELRGSTNVMARKVYTKLQLVPEMFFFLYRNYRLDSDSALKIYETALEQSKPGEPAKTSIQIDDKIVMADQLPSQWGQTIKACALPIMEVFAELRVFFEDQTDVNLREGVSDQDDSLRAMYRFTEECTYPLFVQMQNWRNAKTYRQMREALGWGNDKIKRGVDELLGKGLAVREKGKGVVLAEHARRTIISDDS